MVALGVFLLALSILISVLLHEAGHMFVAKSFGMKVTRYFVGFGNTLWSFRRGETEYGIKSIPAGGFVNIVGQVSLDDVAPEDYPRAMVTKPAYQRFLVLVAGSVTHFIIALILFAIAFLAYAQPDGNAQIDGVGACSAKHCPKAPATGILQKGDIVTQVDGKDLTDGRNQLPDVIQKSGGRPVHFTLERDGQTLHRTITPHKVDGTYVVGIEVTDARSHQSFLQAIKGSG
ncbi:MAG TPA: site-2 protease family protein, partial [Mycobacteriales bacterium]|nr:site-2 protease family protein [Mycobacteriales bacterium]